MQRSENSNILGIKNGTCSSRALLLIVIYDIMLNRPEMRINERVHGCSSYPVVKGGGG